MKSYILFFMFAVLVSCSGTKTITKENAQKDVAATTAPKDNTSAKTLNDDVAAAIKKTTNAITVAVEAVETPINDSVSKVDKQATDKLKSAVTVKDSIVKETTAIKDNVATKPVLETPEAPKTPEIVLANHDAFNTLLNRFVTAKGNVNYIGFKQNRRTLLNYINHLAKNTPQDNWSRNDKLAYWINAYNALTIDLILRHWPVKSIKDIDKPWDQRFWKLGNKWYNLSEIEHDILRKMNDPRIHFAIVCASYSCPKLQNKVFKASTMNAQLTNATKSFLSDPARNNITANTLELSKIFQWFAKDFKQDGNLISFLNKYSAVKINSNAKKRFKDYNWSLNE